MESIHPPAASREDWLAARLELLQLEKALTKECDRISALRRRLPMVKVEKDYRFTGAEGEKGLLDLFNGQTQLIVYHFMFDTDWEKGCPGCTSFINSLGSLKTLSERDTEMVLVSRAPYEKLAAWREAQGWSLPWFSSGGSDFNCDFGATIDPARGFPDYNYRIGPALAEDAFPMEVPGASVFFRVGSDAYHTYSTYARGLESLSDSYRLLDITPFGRQEDFEDSPEGWPQKPTYG